MIGKNMHGGGGWGWGVEGGGNISGKKCYLCLSFYFLYCDGNKYCQKMLKCAEPNFHDLATPNHAP